MTSLNKRSIRPVDQASCEMMREAVRGRLDWDNAGDYLHDATVGAGAGALGGLPGAGVGAVVGAGMHGVQDVWYHLMAGEGKAVWQAEDLSQQAATVAGLVEQINPQLAQQIGYLGTAYHDLVDGRIKGNKDVDLSKNIFMLPPEQQAQMMGQPSGAPPAPGAQATGGGGAFQQGYQDALRALASKTGKFERTAQSPLDQYIQPAKQLGGQMTLGYGVEQAVGKHTGQAITNYLENKGAHDLLKGGMQSGWKGPLGIVSGLATDYGLNALQNLKSVESRLEGYSKGMQEIITEVDQLTKNDPYVSQAGATIMKLMAQALQEANAKATQAQAQSQTQAPAQPPASPALVARIMKFRRVEA